MGKSRGSKYGYKGNKGRAAGKGAEDGSDSSEEEQRPRMGAHARARALESRGLDVAALPSPRRGGRRPVAAATCHRAPGAAPAAAAAAATMAQRGQCADGRRRWWGAFASAVATG